MAGENSTPSQSLLNLLNISHTNTNRDNGSTSTDRPSPSAMEGENAENSTAQPQPVSASDLIAKFMPSQMAPIVRDIPLAPSAHGDSGGGGQTLEPTPSASQDALLRLLSRSTSATAKMTNTGSSGRGAVSSLRSSENLEPDPDKARNDSAPPNFGTSPRRESPIRYFGSSKSREDSPFEAPKLDEGADQKENKPIFTYTNPFEALNASRNQTPKPGVIESSNAITGKSNAESNIDNAEGPAMLDFHHGNVSDLTSTRKKLTPKPPSRSSSALLKNLATVTVKDEDLDIAEDIVPRSPPEGAIGQDVPKTDKAQQTEVTPNFADEHNPLAHDPDPETVKDAGEEASGDGGREWESADESAQNGILRQVPVYNFPIKPFVAITLQAGPLSDVRIREGGVMEISRLKKDFDQIDRTLASATSKYIAYALVKNGGIRIIRQDDGSDRQVFKNSHDRIFNVAFCSTAMIAPPGDHQAILGTAVSGAVYYAPISTLDNDLFEKSALESESLIFPPFPLGNDNSSGGVLKTRAKRSSRHPEFFAIGRGKSIHLVWPAVASAPKFRAGTVGRHVDVEKLYRERGVKITTGKAGKDFTFSEDDTLIVSLDKVGRLRFWDIRSLLAEASAASAKNLAVNLDLPILTLSTASPAEKSWPTSVLFVDKSRPYTRNGALRYLLVGFRQNHTLQLWDIALGKAVQELNFPHESETDGICSVNYHPNSGIIVVSHPTRNSIYFIHLSAPKYSLPAISQADYVERIASRSPQIPKPESTACMSGIREISFAEKGQLRSVDLLPIYKVGGNRASAEPQGLFELYVVHSKGVTCLNIGKEDLGWNSESKVVHAIDAASEGIITLKDLRLGGAFEEAAEFKGQSEETRNSAKPSKKKPAGKSVKPVEISLGPPVNDLIPRADSSMVKSEQIEDTLPTCELKGVRRSAAAVAANATTSADSSAPLSRDPAADEVLATVAQSISQGDSGANGNSRVYLSTTGNVPDTIQDVTVGVSGDRLDKELKEIEKVISAEFRKELNLLHRNIQNDRNVQDSAAAARHEAVLRLVSSSLSTNIEKSLSRIISAQIQQVVVPAISSITLQAVTSQVGEAVARILHQIIPHELSTQLPVAINGALQSPQTARTISENITLTVGPVIESQISDHFPQSISSSLRNVITATAEKTASDVESRLNNYLSQLEEDRRSNDLKVEQTRQLVQGMAETLQTMSDSQVAFQGQILKERRSTSHSDGPLAPDTKSQVSTARRSPSVSSRVSRDRKAKDTELDEIAQLMDEGRYEEGSVKWLQSAQPTELFDRLFVRFTPEYLATDVSSLVAFSIAITVANSLSTNLVRRINWMNAAFAAVDLQVSQCHVILGNVWRMLTKFRV